MQIESLFTYPVKSMRGSMHVAVELTSTGFAYDRAFMVVEADTHVFLSSRNDPILTRFRANIIDDFLRISFDHTLLAHVSLRPRLASETYSVRVHNTWQLGVDQGDHVALKLSKIIGRPVRLVKKATTQDRFSPERAGAVEVAFADSFPILLTSVESLRELNGRLERKVWMERFRPNIVLSGLNAPFDEDFFDRFDIGKMPFQGRTRCTRCAITQTDQRTGERGAEPLRTLMSYRVFPGSKRPCFGLNVNHLRTGWIAMGQSITVHSRQQRNDAKDCEVA